MKRKMKQLLALGVTLCLTVPTVGTMGGCSDSDSLQISTLNAGYGSEWLHALVRGYQQKHPEVEIEVNDSYYGGLDKNFVGELTSGESDTDIYFTRSAMYQYMQKGQNAGGTYYECILEDMTSWYQGTNPYDDQTVAQKLRSDIYEAITVNKKGQNMQYTVPWISNVLGLLYNTQVVGDRTLPNTTDELVAFCDDLKRAGITPFVDSYTSTFFTYLSEQWITQYEGLETMNRLWEGYAPNGDRYTAEVLTYDGILETYKVYYELLCAQNGYVHADSQDIDFTTAQNYVLDGSYKVAMMPNGDWIQREMENNYTPDEIHVQFMKLPIVSSIVNKLEYRNAGAVMTDEVLSQLIAAIDNGATTKEEVASIAAISDSDMAKLLEARGIVTGYSFGHVGYIPVYSDKKDLAKDFLYYMVSDEGLRIITQATNGSTAPYDFDYLGDATTSACMNDFSKNAYKLFRDSKYVSFEIAKNPLFSLGGVTLNYNWTGTSFVQAFTANNTSANYMTAEEFFLYRYNMYNAQWSKVLTSAGLSSVIVG